MESATRLRTVTQGVIATAATAALLYFGNGLNPIWPLMWFAFIPVLWFALRSSWGWAATASFAALLLGNLNLYSYVTSTLGLPASAWIQIVAAGALVFAFITLLFRALALRGAMWSALIALPAAWTTMEFIRNFTTPHGTAASLAYTQLAFLPFLQLASITGPWGMTFFLLLFPSAVVLWLHHRATYPQRARRILLASLATLAAILLFGAVRLNTHTTNTVRVGLIASDIKGNGNVVDAGAPAERLFRDYAQAAQALIAQGAKAIVIPEKLAVIQQTQSQPADTIFQSLADKTGVTVVAGVVDVDGAVKYNQARIYSPNAPLQTYDKEHMLPPFESNLTPGNSIVLLPRQKQVWGVAICKDMDFPSLASRYGTAGVGLLLVPAWDFVVDAGWHGHIAIMRGVEDGFSIARAAKNGYLTVSDSRGRILAELRSNTAPFATLLANVPAEHHATLYQKLGNWFAGVAVALLAFALVQWSRLQLKRA
ncbi:MAG: hypothetical protein KGN79_02240 [Acidobacteriota bacterium]|nr:hypothetical protein [Acidobacteriota bacterium]